LVKEYQKELHKVEQKLETEIPLDMKMFPFLPIAFT